MTLLVDTGPLVAVCNPKDAYHTACVINLHALRGESMITTWQCVTEAMHFLGKASGYYLQDHLWKMRRSGILQIHGTTEQEADRIDLLMNQYSNFAMDLADASLITAAEFLSLRRLFTNDTEFHSYILVDGSVMDIII